VIAAGAIAFHGGRPATRPHLNRRLGTWYLVRHAPPGRVDQDPDRNAKAKDMKESASNPADDGHDLDDGRQDAPVDLDSGVDDAEGGGVGDESGSLDEAESLRAEIEE